MNKHEIAILVYELDSYTPCRKTNDAKKQTLLIERIVIECSKLTQPQQEKIIFALKLSARLHQGVYRANHITPYFLHTLEVTCVAFDFEVYDFKIIVACILHDTVEDSIGGRKKKVIRKLIQSYFGKHVYILVDAVTKHENLVLRFAFWYHLKKIVNPHLRWRAIFIKFCDRIANSETFHILEKGRRDRKLLETHREFPKLEMVLSKTLLQLYEKGDIQKEEYLSLPWKLSRHLFLSLEKYEIH